MQTWKTRYSNRLFFFKYPYKVSLHIKGASKLREGLDYIMNLPDKPISKLGRPMFGTGVHHIDSKNEAIENKQKLIKIGTVLDSMDNIKLRIEGSTCNVFCQDQHTVDVLISELDSWIKEVHVPADPAETEFLLSNPKHVVVNELPYEHMQFRVHLSSSKIMDANTAKKFIEWADKLSENSVVIPKGLRIDLSDKKYTKIYTYGRYFYARDEKLVAMAHMWFTDYISRVDKYICRSTISAGK